MLIDLKFDSLISRSTLLWFDVGMRFQATSRASRMVYTTITGAGLMDPATVLYSSAIKIDFNVHTLENLNISKNTADGLQIMHNDAHGNCRLTGSFVEDNIGNGVTVRGSFFELFNCTLSRNGKAGFEYNPSYSTYEALQIRAGIHDYFVFNQSASVKLENDEVKWFITPQKFTHEVMTYRLEISSNQQYRVSI